MPIIPISKNSHWRYDVDLKNRVRIVSPSGEDYASVYGKNREDRINKAAIMVHILNKNRI